MNLDIPARVFDPDVDRHPMQPSNRGSEPGQERSPWAYLGLGFELAAPPLLGVFIGYYLDRRFATTPWLLITGAMLGILVGFYGFFRAVLPSRKGGE